MDGETTGIILSAGTVSSLCTLAGLWIKAKFGQKTKIDPCPIPVQDEQTAFQAHCKDNDKDHTNIFARVSTLEQKVSAMDAKFDATFNAIQRQLDSMNTMLSQLFERIIKGRK